MTTRVAIIIVCWESHHVIEAALQSALASCHSDDKVIVWDNHSSLASREAIIRLTACGASNLQVHLHDANIGFAAANNAAVAMVPEARFILTLNPDAVLAKGAMQAMLECLLADSRLASVGAVQMQQDDATIDGLGDVYHASGIAWREGHGRPYETEHAVRAATTPVFGPCAAAALYRRDAFCAVGGFDEDFFCYFEDVDLAFRLRLAGWEAARCNRARVAHIGGSSTGPSSDFPVYHGHRNLVWCFVKNMPTALLVVLTPLHLAMSLVTVIWFASQGRLAVILRAKRDAMRGLPQALRKRRDIQKKRVASTLAVWRWLTLRPIR